jgi:hypothetical protein
VEDGGHVRLGYTRELFRQMLGREVIEVVHTEEVVGPVSQAVMDFGRWLIARPLRFFPAAVREGISGMAVLALLPLTWLDRLTPNVRGLCIYVQVRSVGANEK